MNATNATNATSATSSERARGSSGISVRMSAPAPRRTRRPAVGLAHTQAKPEALGSREEQRGAGIRDLFAATGLPLSDEDRVASARIAHETGGLICCVRDRDPAAARGRLSVSAAHLRGPVAELFALLEREIGQVSRGRALDGQRSGAQRRAGVRCIRRFCRRCGGTRDERGQRGDRTSKETDVESPPSIAPRTAERSAHASRDAACVPEVARSGRGRDMASCAGVC